MDIDSRGIIWDQTAERRPLVPEEVAICRRFLGACIPTRTATAGSYGLKHAIEAWAGRYVSNGSCIRAALDLGLKVEPIEPGKNPNAFIGIRRGRMRLLRGGWYARLAHVPVFRDGATPAPPRGNSEGGC